MTVQAHNEAVLNFSDADFEQYIQHYDVARLPMGKSEHVATVPNRDDLVMRRTGPMGGFFPEDATHLQEHASIYEARLGDLAARNITIPAFRSYAVDECPWTKRPAIYTVVQKVEVGRTLDRPGNEQTILELGHTMLDHITAIPGGQPQPWGLSKREQFSVGGASGEQPMLLDLDYYLTRDPRRFFPKFMAWVNLGKGSKYEADFNDLRERTIAARNLANIAHRRHPAASGPLWGRSSKPGT